MSTERIQLIKIDEIMTMLSMGRRTVARLQAERKIPQPLRIGGRSLRWDLRVITAWVAAGTPDVGKTGWTASGEDPN